MLKKILLGILILMAVCSLLLVGQIYLATYLYDSKLQSSLNKVQRAIPNLSLRYEAKDGSFTERRGRLFYNIKLKPNNTLGVSNIEGAVDLKILFGPLRVSGAVDSVKDVGNINQLLSKFNVEPIDFTGAFKATALAPKLEGTVKTDSFLIPTSTGICKLGQNSLAFQATSSEDVDIDFSSAGVVCEGAIRYNEKPSYRLDLLGLHVEFLPRIIDKKPHFESLTINIDNLDFNFSTLYAIGFSPEDQVRDPSLQEAISFSNVSTSVTLSEPDSQGFVKLSFDNRGNYGFAFPYIQENQTQPFYKFDDFKFAGSLERISIPILFKTAQDVLKNASETLDTSAVFHALLQGMTPDLNFTIENFGYSHEGNTFKLSGNTVLAFDRASKKPRIAKFDSDYSIEAAKSIIEEAASDTYAEALAEAVSKGQIAFDGTNYKTHLVFKNKQLALNDIAIQKEELVSQDDMLYEEEQAALRAEKAEQRAEDAALQAEIEAAKQAQQRLPSLVEGNLSEEHGE